MLRNAAAFSATAIATVLIASPATAPAQPNARPSACFRSSQFQGFRPAGNKAMIVRVNISDFYRVEFAQACPEINYPAAHLVTVNRGGSDMICSGIDWDLKIAQSGPGGFATPCIVSSQRKLSKDEVAALPKGQKP
jgi:hypothetical protein